MLIFAPSESNYNCWIVIARNSSRWDVGGANKAISCARCSAFDSFGRLFLFLKCHSDDIISFWICSWWTTKCQRLNDLGKIAEDWPRTGEEWVVEDEDILTIFLVFDFDYLILYLILYMYTKSNGRGRIDKIHL